MTLVARSMTRVSIFLALLTIVGCPVWLLAVDPLSYLDWSAHDEKWHGSLGGEFKAGNERQISQVGLTLPLAQSETNWSREYG